MPRLLDLECEKCGDIVRDRFFRKVPRRIVHGGCGGRYIQVFLPPKSRNAGWSDRDAVVVFRTPTGEIKYPMRNDAPTPAGCERVVMRSLREVEKFERDHGVRNEAMWYDRNGRGFEDEGGRSNLMSDVRERERRFMESWRG